MKVNVSSNIFAIITKYAQQYEKRKSEIIEEAINLLEQKKEKEALKKDYKQENNNPDNFVEIANNCFYKDFIMDNKNY